jgi:hypothetical protein
MLVLVCQVCVVFPLVIYLGNLDEAGITLPKLLGICLLSAITALALLLAISLLVPASLKRFYNGLLSVISILFWVQGAVLVRDYGLLDGASIDWGTFENAGLVDTSIWITGILAGVALIRLGKGRLLLRVAGFLVVIQFASAVVDASLKFDDIQLRKLQTYNSDPTRFYEFSKSQNIIHVLVDGFQSDIFADIVSAPGIAADYTDLFSGFIYFKETLGVFPYTQFALPALLTGKIYLNKEPKHDFLDRVMSGPSILSVAEEKGFDIDIAAAGTYLYGQYTKLPHDNIFFIDSLGSIDPETSTLLKLADITAFRLAPHALKRFVYNDQKWTFQSLIAGNESFKFSFFQNTQFLEELTRKLSATRDKPVYKYIHVSTTHRPMVASFDCGYAGRTFGDSRTTLTIQSKCTLDTVGALFDKLKSAGIYDSSLIIVHADHGGWVPNRRQGEPVRLPKGNLAPPAVKSLASPLLAIKPPRSDGPLVVSEAYVSLLDLPDTISDIMRFDVNFQHRSAFDTTPEANRTRPFYLYFWQKNEYEEEYTDTIHEFMIQGSHYESEWILRSVHHRP